MLAADADLIATTGARTSARSRGALQVPNTSAAVLAQYVAICASLVHVLKRFEPLADRPAWVAMSA